MSGKISESILEVSLTDLYMHSLLPSVKLAHPPPNQFLVGLCTGSIAAAAISCTKTTVDLLPLGVEAILVAFWVGMHASRRANALVPSALAHSKPWTLLLPGLSESEVIDVIKGTVDIKVCTRSNPTCMQSLTALFWTESPGHCKTIHQCCGRELRNHQWPAQGD